MAANQRQKSSGRKSQARPSRASDSAEQGTIERYANEFGSEVSRYASRGAAQLRDATRDHEGAAVVVALAAGLGVGILIGAALASSHSRPNTWRERIAAEGLGRRLLERVESMIPEALSQYVHR
jgi:hypothetical protein